MPFPSAKQGWPPRVASSHHSLRFYQTGTATVNADPDGGFADNAWLFSMTSGIGTAGVIAQSPNIRPGDIDTPADLGSIQRPIFAGGSLPRDAPSRKHPAPRPNLDESVKDGQVYSGGLRITAIGGYLEFSFDGVNVHGRVVAAGAVPGVGDYPNRHEAGICVRGTATTFIVEAW